MLKYKVFADAAADIPLELRERYSIHTLPIPVTMGKQTYLSGTELENDAFYQMLESYDGIPVTSQITPYEFEELFNRELEQGTQELLVFLINSKGSATYNNAVMSRERFYAEHPQAKEQLHIHLLDGASYSVGYGYAAVIAAQKLEMGAEIGEVLDAARRILQTHRLYFGLYSLKYAGKSGRIPSAAVFVGEALGIKPIMQIWEHAITTVGKARGEKKLVREIVKTATDDMEPSTPYCLVYGNDTAAMEELKEEMTKKVGYPPVYQFQVGPAVAINAGPRLTGVLIEVARKRLEKEKSKEKK